MKLLLDQNLSYRLIPQIITLYPDSKHVVELGMDSATDSDIWDYAKKHDMIIVSKDSDFHQRSFLYGAPPKVIWIEKGNCSTQEILSILKKSKNKIEKFSLNQDSSFLVL